MSTFSGHNLTDGGETTTSVNPRISQALCGMAQARNNLSAWNNTTNSSTYVDGIPSCLLDPNVLAFRQVIHWCDLYLVPVIALVGIVGNMTSFLVFTLTYLRRMSASVYLAGLAISATAFLVVVLASWGNNVGVHIYHRAGFCQTFVYIAYVSSFLSVWYVVAFTVERYLVVRFPLKRLHISTPRRARIVVSLLATLGGALYTFAPFTSDIIEYYQVGQFCGLRERHYRLVAAINNADTLITLLIPTVIIIYCNSWIGAALAAFYRTRQTLEEAHTTNSVTRKHSSRTSGSRASSGCTGSPICAAGSSSYHRLQIKVTKLLLLVSSVFLICNIPSHSIRVYVFFAALASKSYQPSHKLLLVQKLFQMVYYVNFGVNAFLYSLSGKTFRKALVRMIQKTRRRITECVRLRYWRMLTIAQQETPPGNHCMVKLRGNDNDFN